MSIIYNSVNIFETLKEYNQQHLLTFWDDLSENEKSELIADLSDINFKEFIHDVEKSTSNKVKGVISELDPPNKDVIGGWSSSHLPDIAKYKDIGMKSLANGECCAILMAGGAGTRLGVNYPKGMYDIGLPSHKSLFQIQAENLLRLENLVKRDTGIVTSIMWYIMTSDCTRRATVEYFETKNFFGLSPEQVVFFEQSPLPVIGVDGKIILESKFKVLKSPDGNGGLYRALRNFGIIDDMKQRGIKYAHVYGVDNILVKVADPIFFGFLISKGKECAAKVVEKTNPTETVGVLAKVGGSYQVVEYSEISKETTELLDTEDSTKLMYRCGSICSHIFTVDFLDRICHENSSSVLTQHVALKKVPFINLVTGELEVPTTINAIKLEKFVFDVFPLAKSFAIWEVERDHEFSPLKNAPGSKTDCPETCKAAVLNYHSDLVRASLKDSDNLTKASKITFEISPLVSFRGEGLGEIDLYLESVEAGSTVLFDLNDRGDISMEIRDDYII